KGPDPRTLQGGPGSRTLQRDLTRARVQDRPDPPLVMAITPPERKPGPNTFAARRRPNRRRLQEDELIEEILATAEQIATASHPDGERVFRTDHRWRLLRAIERSHYCFSISDLARVLRIPRQRAHEVVTAAAKARDVKVLPN